MEEQLIKFWRYIRFNWEAEDIDDALEEYPLDTDALTRAHLSTLTEDELYEVFAETVEWFMDALGVDNYAEVADVLTSCGVDEDTIANLLA
jgi:hypothetical protein